LDRVFENILGSFSSKDKAFYEREFSFFNKITGISGSLKPLVQAGATKADKKV
jgi:phosphatidylinositol 4-kinase